MKRKTKLLATLLMLSGVLARSGNVFAENIYGIEYSGGEPLSSDNVTVDTSLSDLTALYNTRTGQATFSDSDKWESVYIKPEEAGRCHEYHMIRVWDSNRITDSDDVYVKFATQSYDVKVQINKIILDNTNNLSEDGAVLAVGTWGGIIAAGWSGQRTYSDPDCTVRYDENIRWLNPANDERIFVQTNIKLYKHGNNEVFTSDKLYFGLIDFDAGQSFKILSPNALLTNTSMFAMSDDAFSTPDEFNNMFVANNNYLYSEYDGWTHFDYPDMNNIYIKVDTTTQSQGLDAVFGYANAAGSSVVYYAKQHNIKYQSDEGGDIDGITTEDVISGNIASGSSVDTRDGFELLHWEADVDIVLEDGTEIEAGEPISTEQLSQIIVSEDIVVTAIHEDHRHTVTYETDEGGEITGITEEPVVPEGNPTGTETAPNENYVFDHWEADVDVVLEDGTEIIAGDPITPEQVTQIIVTEDITLTAVYKSTAPAVPNTGLFTKVSFGAKEISISVLAIVIAAALAKLASMLSRKKISFDK